MILIIQDLLPGLSQLILDDPEIQKLSPFYKEKKGDTSNFEFITEVQNFIYSPIKSSNEYYKLKEELLKRIIKMTPPEFTEERKPNPSFSQLYEDLKYKYAYFMEHDNFSTMIPEYELNELSELLDNFRSISNDQYHFAILNKTLPIVLNDSLIKNTLKSFSSMEKEVKKPNGFQAIYYTIKTPFGDIEAQAQSNKAHYAATKGSAYHSGIDGKTVNVKDFFELVDPNDENDLSYYLDFLDSASADTLIDFSEIPEFENEEEKRKFLNTLDGKNYLASQKCNEMMKHIKIKDKMQVGPQKHSDTLTYINADDYLLSTAISISPYMNVCGSGHTSSTTAAIHHKKVIDEFSEILRKKDSNTCLRDLLIRRLELLIDNDGIIDNSSKEISSNRKASIKIVKNHEEESLKLPKDVSRKNIMAYGEKLKNIKKDLDDDELVK